METDCVSDEEIDFAFTSLHRRFGHRIYSMSGYSIGAAQRLSDVRSGVRGVFRSVFFILDGDGVEPDFTIPAGDYLSMHYRGRYEQSPSMIDEVLSYADSSGYSPRGDILEIYRIDIHETNDVNEFLTELQVMITLP
jgi:hypothetical protein